MIIVTNSVILYTTIQIFSIRDLLLFQASRTRFQIPKRAYSRLSIFTLIDENSC